MIFKKLFGKKTKKQQEQPEPKVFVIDTNMLLNGKADFFARISANRQDISIRIPWAVNDELSRFRRESFSKSYGHTSPSKHDVRNTWSTYSQKIEDCEWRLVGSRGKEFRELFQQNGFILGYNDVRILCAVGTLMKKFKEVFLVSRDWKLCEVAKELGIQTIRSLKEFSEIAEAEK